MRNLFLALLLGNLGFWAWHAWFAAAPPAAVPLAGQAAPSLTLTTEMPARRAAASESAVSLVASGCASIGPFADLTETGPTADTLRAAGHSPMPRAAESDRWIGYWVYIVLPRTEDSRAVLAKVREAGMTDSYVMPNTDGGNLLSLGLVGDSEAMSRRSEQIRALGFEPQILDRTRRTAVYWLDVQLADGLALDLDALATPSLSAPLEQRPCEGGGL